MSGDRAFVSWLYDLRYGLRSLSRSPLFTIVAVLTLAIGVGATTAVFSVVNSVLLEPLPYPQADELVSVRHVAPGAPGLADASGGLRPSPSMYFTYADENRSFENLGLWIIGTANVTGIAEPEEARIISMTDGVLQALAVPPLLGRWFGPSDQAPGAPPTVMLTHDYWQSRFGGDESAIGRDIRVDELPREIVGVMPPGFRIADADADVLMPTGIDRSQLIPPPFCCQIVARLRDGMSIEEANADVARMLPIWMDSWTFRDGRSARSYESWQIAPALRPLKADVVGDIGSVLWIVLAMIGFVLIIACTNVANLLLVRADARQRELAVRAALGAGSWRIGRVVVLESMLLGLASGVLGVLVGYAILNLLVTLGPSNLPRLDEISLDARALAVALSVALLSGLALGLIPALRYAAPRLAGALQSGGRSVGHGRERHRAQNVLVVAQVALALVLLVSSGLMMRTFQALRTVEPGFTQAEELQTVRISIPSQLVPDPQRVAQVQNDIVDAVATVPGVTSAAFSSAMPLEMRGNNWDGIDVEGRDPPRGDGAHAMRIFKYVSPGLLTTAGTRLVAGRDITWTEVHDLRPVAMVSENLARELWGEPAAALGERIRVGGPNTPWREVVGVVQDVRENGVQESAPAMVYWPPVVANFYPGESWSLQRSVTVVVRSPLAGTQGLVEQIQRAVWSVNPSLPVADVRTMQEIYNGSLSRTSFTLVMLGIASGVALVLGVVGLYGVLSYVVSQRRREIAIRLALGAQRRALHRSFVGYGLALAGVGVAVGLVAAGVVTRLMTSLLYDVRPLDWPTYTAVAVLLTVAAALASYLPARKASNVPPAEALAAD
jgi:predicted permease